MTLTDRPDADPRNAFDYGYEMCWVEGADAMLADMIPSEKRTDAYAINRIAHNASFALGPDLVAGFGFGTVSSEEKAALARDARGSVDVPPTIQALLQARLDTLNHDERIVIERGSVEGQIFHRGAVAALTPAAPT